MKDLTICMGSACHQMGITKTVEILNRLLEENGLRDQVNFKGAFCLGECGAGIVLEFEGKHYLHINPGTVEDVFYKRFCRIFQKGCRNV